MSPDFHPHESPRVMTVPLVVLAVLSAVGAAINLPFGHSGPLEILGRWLEPVVEHGQATLTYSNSFVLVLLVVSLAVAIIGILAARAVYLDRKVKAVEPEFLANAWYIDSTIAAFVARSPWVGSRGASTTMRSSEASGRTMPSEARAATAARTCWVKTAKMFMPMT